MKSLMRMVCAALALALAACGPKADTAGPGPALWRLADADSEIWLMGTVHVLPEGLEWKSPAIQDAFAKADVIWFETPTDAAASERIGAILAREGANPPGVTLTSRLSGEDRARLGRVAAALGLNPASLEPLRPWLVALQLSLAQLQQQGHAAEYGVEQTLEADALRAGKTRRYFETAEEQMAIFSTLSPAAELAFFSATLRQIEEEKTASQDMDRLWASGDAAGFAAFAQKLIDEAGPETAEALVYARNARWADRIDEMMQGEGKAFVAVGAAHMVGERGLPALLRAEGHAVEGP